MLQIEKDIINNWAKRSINETFNVVNKERKNIEFICKQYGIKICNSDSANIKEILYHPDIPDDIKSVSFDQYEALICSHAIGSNSHQLMVELENTKSFEEE